MIILIPLAFVGASLYNGKDPIVEAKKLLGMEETTEAKQVEPQRETSEDTAPAPTDAQADSVPTDDIRVQLREVMSRIEQLERDKMQLEEQVKNQAVEIKELRRQLNARN
jgi:TolA-binding protein